MGDITTSTERPKHNGDDTDDKDRVDDSWDRTLGEYDDAFEELSPEVSGYMSR